MMLDTHSSLETLDVGGEDRVRHSRFPTDPLHHLHLVCHLPLRQKQQKLISAEENTLLPFLNTAVSVQPSVGGCQDFTYELLRENKPTCGTHFGDTKLVASMTGSPDADNMSIR